MPYSYNALKPMAREFLRGDILESDRVLDVGPGAGTYARLLPEVKMDCVEIYKPYVRRFHLGLYYSKVFVQDIRDFALGFYTYIIMGDVFEHLSHADARALLDRVAAANARCFIGVPYMLEQGPSEGNEHETHLQPDLTQEVMAQRYPELSLVFGNDLHGYYTNY